MIFQDSLTNDVEELDALTCEPIFIMHNPDSLSYPLWCPTPCGVPARSSEGHLGSELLMITKSDRVLLTPRPIVLGCPEFLVAMRDWGDCEGGTFSHGPLPSYRTLPYLTAERGGFGLRLFLARWPLVSIGIVVASVNKRC